MNARPVVFRAKRVHTMNPMQPLATHIAVREGRILAVGSEDDARAWGIAETDDSFADQFLIPGLVEAHCHLHEGALWSFPYMGYYDRRGPDGEIHPGLKTLDAVVEKLTQVDRAQPGLSAPLLAWGFDPVFFGSERLTTRVLDRVPTRRPMALLHASLHLMNVNTAMLNKAGIKRDTQVEGIVRYPDGEPTGELREFAAMFPVNRAIGNAFKAVPSVESTWRFARVATFAGVTTATDMFNDAREATVAALDQVTREPDFPLRIVPGALKDPSEAIEAFVGRVHAASGRNNEKLRYGMVKIVVDGSIQGFTARLRWPGYHNGKENGVWILPPSQLDEVVEALHRCGLQLHIHTNGDEATQVALDAIDKAVAKHPRRDHRHTLHHCQMADTAQFRRMKELGVCVNLFANHLFYWGDIHYEHTIGPGRANRMDACGSARRFGVPYAIHCDAPVTPLGPLFTAWCAVNRRTAGGRVLGTEERIPVFDALAAITIGAAYTLHLDHEIGSIEIGKRADFCVLTDDPCEKAPQELKDTAVSATVVGGRVFHTDA